MSPLAGFRRVPGKSERYLPPSDWQGPTGPNGTISRRQYENYRARQNGWSSWSEYQRDRRTDDYLRWQGEFSEKQKGQMSWRGPHSDFAEAWIDAKRSGWNHDPNGPFADLLVLTGHRDAEWEWDVGDTNPQ